MNELSVDLSSGGTERCKTAALLSNYCSSAVKLVTDANHLYTTMLIIMVYFQQNAIANNILGKHTLRWTVYGHVRISSLKIPLVTLTSQKGCEHVNIPDFVYINIASVYNDEPCPHRRH